MQKTTIKLRLFALFLLAALLFTGCNSGKPINAEDSVDSFADSTEYGYEEGSEEDDISRIELHFLDVGQADSTLIICDGEAMLIDGGNKEDSSFLYTYLKRLGVSHIKYLVATHAHEDHIGGLAGALNYATADVVYCSVTQAESEVFASFLKYAKKVTVPKVGDSLKLGSARVDILGVNSASGANNSSIVLKVTHGETSFLFTGDAEREAEQAILNSGVDLKSTLLKVGHHGSDSSTSYSFLREVMPSYAVISVGEDNVYGHPDDTVLSRLGDAGATVYRTDLEGTVICVGDGHVLWFDFPDRANGVTYILNASTKKFHLSSCPSAKRIEPKNRREVTCDREEMISRGYYPCGVCES